MTTTENNADIQPDNNAPQDIDLLIHARHIMTQAEGQESLENHSVAAHKGRILGIFPHAEAETRFRATHTHHLQEHVLLPGLINAHTHAAMTLLRGFADDLPLMSWLQDRIWPAEAKHVSAEFVQDGTLLAAAEMLRGGITCCNDMYFFPDAAARAFTSLGMRAMLGVTVLEFPTRYANDADDYLTKGLAVRDTWRDHPLLSFCLAPHAPYTVSDRTFERITTLSAQLDIPVHIHLHESSQEIEDSLRQHGMRPLARLQKLGLLTPSLIGVHAIHLDDIDIAMLADAGASVVHNPTSNMKLANGAAPVARLIAAGINVALGSDGAASNNRLDVLQEMRHAALLGKLAANDPCALNARQILHMATLGGARNLGLEHDIGSIETGKLADLCAIRLSDIESQPIYDLASHMVYVLGREQVSHVWVGGQCRVNNHRLVDFDHLPLLQKAQMWQNRLRLSE